MSTENKKLQPKTRAEFCSKKDPYYLPQIRKDFGWKFNPNTQLAGFFCLLIIANNLFWTIISAKVPEADLFFTKALLA